MSRINPSNYERLGQHERILRTIRFFGHEVLFQGNGLNEDDNLAMLTDLVKRCQVIADGDADLMVAAKQLIMAIIDPEFTLDVENI